MEGQPASHPLIF